MRIVNQEVQLNSKVEDAKICVEWTGWTELEMSIYERQLRLDSLEFIFFRPHCHKLSTVQWNVFSFYISLHPSLSSLSSYHCLRAKQWQHVTLRSWIPNCLINNPRLSTFQLEQIEIHKTKSYPISFAKGNLVANQVLSFEKKFVAVCQAST